MDALTKEEKAKNLAEYKASLVQPRVGEPLVHVRVVSPPGLWYGTSPNTHKLYGEGETLHVPESVFKNSDFHNPKKGVTGVTVRGVLELADRQQGDVSKVAADDLKALLERNAELERKLAVLTGQAPPTTPLVVPDKEEI